MSTRRRVLMAWRAAAVAIVAEREAEQFYQQRAREAQLDVLAARFNRIRVLHPVLHSWAAAAAAAAAARAAAADEVAREDEAREKRMVIAARFHTHCRRHGVVRAWRGAAAAGKAERLEAEQQQQMTSRIDAVLSRVRAAQREGRMRSSDAGQQPPRPQTAGGGSPSSTKTAAVRHAAPRPQSAGRGTRRPPASPRSQLTATTSQSGVQRTSVPLGALSRPGSGRGDGRAPPGRQRPPATPRGGVGAPHHNTVDLHDPSQARGSSGSGGVEQAQPAAERARTSVMDAWDGASTDGLGSVTVKEFSVQGEEGALPCVSGNGEASDARLRASSTSSSSGCEAVDREQHGSKDDAWVQRCTDDHHGSDGCMSGGPGTAQVLAQEASLSQLGGASQQLSRLPPVSAAQEPDAGIIPRLGMPPAPRPGPRDGPHIGAMAMQSSGDDGATGGVVSRHDCEQDSVGIEADVAMAPCEAEAEELRPVGTGQQAVLSKADAVTQSWDSYVDFLKHEVIGRPDASGTAPAAVPEPAPAAAEPAKSILPIQKFSRLRGRQAQEELDAQLARVQAATGVPSMAEGPSQLRYRR